LTFSREDRRKLADKVDSVIRRHEKGNDVDTEVCNKDSDDWDSSGYTSYEQVEIINFYMNPGPN